MQLDRRGGGDSLDAIVLLLMLLRGFVCLMYGITHEKVNFGRMSTGSWFRGGHLWIRVTSHTRDDGISKAIEFEWEVGKNHGFHF